MSVQAQQYSTEEVLPAEPQQHARFPLSVPGRIADVFGRSGVPPRLSREGKLELTEPLRSKTAGEGFQKGAQREQ